MSLPGRSTLAVCLGIAGLCFLMMEHASAQTVWSRLTKTKSFAKPSGADGTLPEFQDTLTPGVIFARGDLGGLYNAATEPNFLVSVSPEFTEWATDLVPANTGQAIDATNWANLTYTTWNDAYGGQFTFGLPEALTSRPAVVHLTLEDIYLDLQFTSWTDGHQIPPGGFSYLRAAPPAPETSGDYNGNHVVDAADYTIWRNTLGSTATPQGSGADGDPNGVIDGPDYDFWKQHFGDVIPIGAGGQALAVPEPAAIMQVLFGLVMLVIGGMKFSSRGPGQTF